MSTKYIITDGDHYINSTSGHHIVNNEDNATKFSKSKVNNVISTLPKYMNKLNLSIIKSKKDTVEKFCQEDFNIVQLDHDDYWVRIKELNEMIKYGAITINKEKININSIQ